MFRAAFLGLVWGLLYVPVLTAQTNGTMFRWEQGQVLRYRVEHITSASETADNKTNETKTRLNLMKRWQVLEVDPAGIATIELSLTALRLETTTPNGSVLSFDSNNSDTSDPQMSEQLKKFVGQPLAVLRVDGLGKVVQIKESRHGPASRFESEPPFVLVFPEGALQEGSRWERSYKITLEPPQGTGDKYDAAQQCVCKSVNQGVAAIALTTTLKTQPESVLDRVPLLQLQPEGEVIFDLQAGRLKSANMHVDKELAGHQGKGSSYRFQSTYREEIQP
jgi:hypothetical protein